jgi:hypothetical protein
VSRVGIGDDMTQPRDGVDRVTDHSLRHGETPPAPARGVPVTVGVGDVTSFFGHRSPWLALRFKDLFFNP